MLAAVFTVSNAEVRNVSRCCMKAESDDEDMTSGDLLFRLLAPDPSANCGRFLDPEGGSCNATLVVLVVVAVVVVVISSLKIPKAFSISSATQ